jgi:hypothetical protein
MRGLPSTVLSSLLLSACAASLEPGVKQDLEAQLATAHRPITACYERALKKNPDLAGKLVVKFRIAETSKVPTFIELAATGMKEPELEKCVVMETQEVRLSAAPGVPLSVTYPLEFSSAAHAAD